MAFALKWFCKYWGPPVNIDIERSTCDKSVHRTVSAADGIRGVPKLQKRISHGRQWCASKREWEGFQNNLCGNQALSAIMEHTYLRAAYIIFKMKKKRFHSNRKCAHIYTLPSAVITVSAHQEEKKQHLKRRTSPLSPRARPVPLIVTLCHIKA